MDNHKALGAMNQGQDDCNDQLLQRNTRYLLQYAFRVTLGECEQTLGRNV